MVTVKDHVYWGSLVRENILYCCGHDINFQRICMIYLPVFFRFAKDCLNATEVTPKYINEMYDE